MSIEGDYCPQLRENPINSLSDYFKFISEA